MFRISFAAAAGRTFKDPLLAGVSIAPLSEPVVRGSSVQVAVFRIQPGGAIRRHPATMPQILAVIEGHGETCGDDGVFAPISPGEAVVWEAGEHHEIRSATGLTAFVVEAPGLIPHKGGGS